MKENVKEATVVMCKCRHAHKSFGIRMEKRMDHAWYCTWAFKMSDKAAAREGYDSVEISGRVDIDDEYPGCPYCGTVGWFSCGRCRKLTCFGNESILTCGWCGNASRGQAGSEFDLTGGGY